MNQIINEQDFFAEIYKEPMGYVPEYELKELEDSIYNLSQNFNEALRSMVDSMQRIRRINYD